MSLPITLPKLSDLPLNPNDPPNSAWGLWKRHGFDEQLGALNYLQDQVVKKSVTEEVQTGRRVGLKYVVFSLQLPLNE